MKLGFSQQQTQTLSLKQSLSPKIIQTLRTFGLSYQDLETEIVKAADTNIMLDVTSGSGAVGHSLGDGNSDFTDYTADTKSEDLYTHLMRQIEFTFLRDKEKAILEDLIESLNDTGFIENYVALKQTLITKHKVADRKIGEVLKILQTFEPEGIGARSLEESLLIQINHHQFQDDRLKDTLKDVVKHHLTNLATKDYATIANALEIDIEGVLAVHQFITHNLTPTPASDFNTPQQAVIVRPSFDISFENGQVVCTNLEQQTGTTVRLSKSYLAQLNDPKTDQETKQYLEELHQKAKTLVDAVQERYNRLNQIMDHICTAQHDFIKRGSHYLEPLPQKLLCDALSLSPSTVSRILSKKYVQTPHGVFLMNTLCPRNIFGKTRERFKQLVQTLAKENPTLSDEKLTLVLNKQGIDIARRTVNKYRRLS